MDLPDEVIEAFPQAKTIEEKDGNIEDNAALVEALPDVAATDLEFSKVETAQITEELINGNEKDLVTADFVGEKSVHIQKDSVPTKEVKIKQAHADVVRYNLRIKDILSNESAKSFDLNSLSNRQVIDLVKEISGETKIGNALKNQQNLTNKDKTRFQGMTNSNRPFVDGFYYTLGIKILDFVIKQNYKKAHNDNIIQNKKLEEKQDQVHGTILDLRISGLYKILGVTKEEYSETMAGLPLNKHQEISKIQIEINKHKNYDTLKQNDIEKMTDDEIGNVLNALIGAYYYSNHGKALNNGSVRADIYILSEIFELATIEEIYNQEAKELNISLCRNKLTQKLSSLEKQYPEIIGNQAYLRDLRNTFLILSEEEKEALYEKMVQVCEENELLFQDVFGIHGNKKVQNYTIDDVIQGKIFEKLIALSDSEEIIEMVEKNIPTLKDAHALLEMVDDGGFTRNEIKVDFETLNNIQQTYLLTVLDLDSISDIKRKKEKSKVETQTQISKYKEALKYKRRISGRNILKKDIKHIALQALSTEDKRLFLDSAFAGTVTNGSINFFQVRLKILDKQTPDGIDYKNFNEKFSAENPSFTNLENDFIIECFLSNKSSL